MLHTKKSIYLLVSLLSLTACQEPVSEWSKQELAIIQSLDIRQLQETSHQSNRFAKNDQAAQLGKAIFFDPRFSQNQSLSCASCHQPEKAFTDGLAKAKGVNKTGRNTITLLGAKYHTWFYWDGRKDSLWAQALVPFEAADEMGSNRVQVLRIIGQDKQYREQYETIFGQFPDQIFNDNIPESAGPWGDTKTRDNWFRIPAKQQNIINRAYANIGKAVAAYERTIPLPETKFDHYLATLNKSEQKANQLLSADEKAGLKLFINQEKTHCLRCHNGPLFSNSDFHNIGTGVFSGKSLDFGRYFGIQVVTQDAFNCLGNYSDAQSNNCSALNFLPKQIHSHMQGAYKTPTLRYLNKTAPYFHDGRFENLDAVITHYLNKQANGSELPELVLTTKEKQQLIAFLNTLNTIE